ncbi:MAG: formate--tetrahydrofolate ligase [Clostridiales bacterium]|nr:formate--tetrahydrofolate ligase [Clostridiales bacterium]
MSALNDISIAQAAQLWPIADVAAAERIDGDSLIAYGRYIAKVDPARFSHLTEQAKLILVTAMTPTPAGEGKTTVSISLADGMRKNGKKAMLALREPSQGPVFGMKGGATGGGYSQVLPMESINLHFTGDLHAITAANNLLAAMIDNHIHQGNSLGIDPRSISFRRCMDMNDRQLRSIVGGLGGDKNGVPREGGFDITAASEVMAVFCMAGDAGDLKRRLADIVVARTYDHQPVTCAQIGAAGAMAALLRDALMPNLVQTIEHTPCLIHGGPFANIAHGCNSAIATKLALKLSDYVVTEAGFGADLGAEKFLDIKCRANGIWPDCVVLVATIRALKHHGGVPKAELNVENVPAMMKGCGNLMRHVRNVRDLWKLPVVVAINRFASDNTSEIDALQQEMDAAGIPCRFSDGWAHGGEGARDLAQCVTDIVDNAAKPEPVYTYPLDMPLADKVEAVAKKVYGAAEVAWTGKAKAALQQLTKEGYGHYPVCIAKTQYSFSDDAKLLNVPDAFEFTVRDVRLSAGAGFVVVFSGDIIAMPGLPKSPAALGIDVDRQGHITGLF